MTVAHLIDASDETTDPGEALTERYHARLAVAFSRQKAAEHGDAPDDFEEVSQWGQAKLA